MIILLYKSSSMDGLGGLGMKEKGNNLIKLVNNLTDAFE
jgi:hypothetical protein